MSKPTHIQWSSLPPVVRDAVADSVEKTTVNIDHVPQLLKASALLTRFESTHPKPKTPKP